MRLNTAGLLLFALTAGNLFPARAAAAPLTELKNAAGPVSGGGAIPVPASPAPVPSRPTVSFNIYARTAPVLIDARADKSAKDLYAFLRSQYGKKIISGQTTEYFGELSAAAGKTPAARAFDLHDYSPHNPWHNDWSAWDDGTVQAALDWYKATNGKGLVTVQWHWFSPSSGQLRTNTFYTKLTDFDVSKAVVPGTPEYTEVLRDIDAIAVQLKRLSDAGIPVLWRPLHEAGAGWFWWGAKGPGPCLKLYDIMYDRLTNYHQLHNLIWVWSTPEAAWYPGGGKVDIVGYDSYPGAYDYAPQSEMFNRLYKMVNGEKMVALSENGPIPDIDDCFRTGAAWLYFLSWNDLVARQNSAGHIHDVFWHPQVVTLGSY